MTQYIAPNMAMAMQYSNRQGMMPSNQYSSGILGLKHGGRARFRKGGLPRKNYFVGDLVSAVTSPFKEILEAPKKLVKKLVPNT